MAEIVKWRKTISLIKTKKQPISKRTNQHPQKQLK